MNIEWILFIIVVCVNVLWIGYMVIDERRRQRRYRERDARQAEEAASKRADAYYKRWQRYGVDPDECDECHLPGDCPLCGAS